MDMLLSLHLTSLNLVVIPCLWAEIIPSLSSFPGDSAGTRVTLVPGDCSVIETLPSFGALQDELSAISVINTVTASGDCEGVFDGNNLFQEATGTVTSGGSQTCTIVNTVNINSGEVPS